MRVAQPPWISCMATAQRSVASELEAARAGLFEAHAAMGRMEERIVELQSVVESLAKEPDRPRTPSKCKTEIQSILFDNADKMPDGLYMQLMNALMIKD